MWILVLVPIAVDWLNIEIAVLWFEVHFKHIQVYDLKNKGDYNF